MMLSNTSYRTRVLAIAALFLAPAAACADIVVPAGLSPGDTYHLAFVTHGTTNATSYNIDDYNSFVQAQTALNPSLTGTHMGVVYKAIGSTIEKAANVNALVSGPVYLLNGTKIVDDFADMWDGRVGS